MIEFRQRMAARGDELLTRCLTLAFEVEAAKRYAEIRCREQIRPADAIQLACAAAARTDLFVTNDNRLSRVVVTGITFITGIERIPY